MSQPSFAAFAGSLSCYRDIAFRRAIYLDYMQVLYSYIYIYVYTHTDVYVCMYVCMYVYIYIYTYVYIYIYA